MALLEKQQSESPHPDAAHHEGRGRVASSFRWDFSARYFLREKRSLS